MDIPTTISERIFQLHHKLCFIDIHRELVNQFHRFRYVKESVQWFATNGFLEITRVTTQNGIANQLVFTDPKHTRNRHVVNACLDWYPFSCETNQFLPDKYICIKVMIHQLPPIPWFDNFSINRVILFDVTIKEDQVKYTRFSLQ